MVGWRKEGGRDRRRKEQGRKKWKEGSFLFFFKKCVVEELQLFLVLEWVATQGNVHQLFTKFES